MNLSTRRNFLKQTSKGVAAASVLGLAGQSVQAAGANDRLVVGVLGCRRGKALGRHFKDQNVELAYACDPDEDRVQEYKKKFGATHAVADMRKVLDDPAVDVVFIATPDHWHAAATLMALDAGKHVYVEKPCSHNIREGRLMIEAAKKSDRIVEVGTQSRSTPVIQEAVNMVLDGAIGEVLMAKGWNSQRRVNIGHMKPSKPPKGLDYDLWVGPSPMQPYQKNCHHYTWHWWYNFGTGDAGNDGVHEMDIARWALGDPDHPTRICGHGSKLWFDDDQQFPDTQYITYEYPGGSRGRRLMVYEQRDWSPYVQEGLEDGNIIYGTNGMLLLGKRWGWKLFGPRNKLIKEKLGKYDVKAHVDNFFSTIRTGSKQYAPIEVGHRSATVAHLANIIAKTGCGELCFDPKTEQITNNPEANALVGRSYRKGHWSAQGLL